MTMSETTSTAIDRDNWRSFVDLSICQSQEGLICSNDRSLAEAGVRGDANLSGIVDADGAPVGILVTLNLPGRLEVHRLMIDCQHQGRGYGKDVLRRVISEEHESTQPRVVGIKFLKWNDRAQAVYESVGFIDTGRFEGDECVYQVDPPTLE